MSTAASLLALLLVSSIVGCALAPATSGDFCKTVVAVAADATEPERDAAAEIAAMVGTLCGAVPLKLTTPAAAQGQPQLAVGVGAATAIGVAPSDLSFSALGAEGFVATSNRSAELRATAGSYALSGAANSTSGTLYGCYHLMRALGVRFLAWDHTMLPAAVPSPLPALDRTFVPVFEYRDVDGWAALSHPQQSKYFHINGGAQASSSSALATVATPPSLGERFDGMNSPYASPPGFVHTSYNLFGPDAGYRNCTTGRCPPSGIFNAHPEWFYPHNDDTVYGQLCWTNQSLIRFIEGQAKKYLSTQPHAKIISISRESCTFAAAPLRARCDSDLTLLPLLFAAENDNGNYCRDPEELKVIQAEGSPMGPLIRAVNQIAKSLAADFPLVAVDTLACESVATTCALSGAQFEYILSGSPDCPSFLRC